MKRIICLAVASMFICANMGMAQPDDSWKEKKTIVRELEYCRSLILKEDYQRGYDLAKKILVIIEEKYSEERALLAEALFVTGEAAKMLGRNDEAKEYFARAKDVRAQKKPLNDQPVDPDIGEQYQPYRP